MSTVTIGVASVDEVKQRARTAFRGESLGEFITFPSVDVLTSVLTKKRWEIIQAMTGRGPMSVRSVVVTVTDWSIRDVVCTLLHLSYYAAPPGCAPCAVVLRFAQEHGLSD